MLNVILVNVIYKSTVKVTDCINIYVVFEVAYTADGMVELS